MTPRLKNEPSPRRWLTGAILATVGAVLIAGSLNVAVHHRGAAHVDAAPGPSDPVAAALAGLSGPIPRGPAAARKVAHLTSADNLPADCVPSYTFGSDYQLGLVGKVTGGVLTAGPATVSNITATFCGVVSVVNSSPPCAVTGSVSSLPDDQVFNPLSVGLDLVPGMSVSLGFTANPGTITGTFSCDSPANSLVVSLDATVTGTTAPLFGVSCTIGPVTIPLTGAVTGPFGNLTATLTSNDFAVPALQASPTCSGGIPANVDAIVGLPIAPGGASASLPITASLYLPAS